MKKLIEVMIIITIGLTLISFYPKSTNCNQTTDYCQIANKQIIIETPIIEEKNKYIYYNIPLNKHLQDLLQDECNKYNLSYELCLSIIKHESNFNPNAISKDGKDKGLFQLRNNTYPQILKKLNLNNKNIMNPEINIKCGTWLLNDLKNYWNNKEYSDKHVFTLTLNSYHFGITKVRNNISKYIKDTKYTNAILDYKIKLEKEI